MCRVKETLHVCSKCEGCGVIYYPEENREIICPECQGDGVVYDITDTMTGYRVTDR